MGWICFYKYLKYLKWLIVMNDLKNVNKKTNSVSSSNKQKFTNKDLKTMQEWTLEHKIQVSQARLLEWYEKWDGECYVSFSGGKDSVVLAYLAAQVCEIKGYELTLWFCNTGLEFPEIVQHVKYFVKWLTQKFPKVEINLINDFPKRGKSDKILGKAKDTRVTYRDVIQEFGYPVINKEVSQKIYEARRKPDGVSASKFEDDNPYKEKCGGCYDLSKWRWLKDSDIPISHMCCKLLKERPAIRYEKKSSKKPIIASMAVESRMRWSQWLQYGCNVFDVPRPHSNPIAFWTDQDILKFCYEYDVPIAKVYGEIKINENGEYYTTGYKRTGCYCCALGVQREKEPNHFQLLKKTHPKLWEHCMKPFDEGGFGMKEILEFIGIKTE